MPMNNAAPRPSPTLRWHLRRQHFRLYHSVWHFRSDRHAFC
jgi:hypothetical protein